MLRHLAAETPLRIAANESSEPIQALKPGDELSMLDDTGGWAWGYAGPDCRVGYVRSEALVP